MADVAARGDAPRRSSVNTPRLLLLSAILAAGLAAALVTDARTAAAAMHDAGADLTRLLRAMAALKALMALGLMAAVAWRLREPAQLGWLTAYGACCAAMAAGPVLIWDMAHVGAGALLLHAGLLTTLVLLWRDPVTSRRLSALVARRRATLRARS